MKSATTHRYLRKTGTESDMLSVKVMNRYGAILTKENRIGWNMWDFRLVEKRITLRYALYSKQNFHKSQQLTILSYGQRKAINSRTGI
jgi:hypothetical protein